MASIIAVAHSLVTPGPLIDHLTASTRVAATKAYFCRGGLNDLCRLLASALASASRTRLRRSRRSDMRHLVNLF